MSLPINHEEKVSVIPALPGYYVLSLVPSADGKFVSVDYDPVIAWCSTSGGACSVPHAFMRPMTLGHAGTDEYNRLQICAVLDPDGRVFEMGESSSFDSLYDWAASASEGQRVERVSLMHPSKRGDDQ